MDVNLQAAEVTTDGQKLERILENLLDNARKFTPEGGRISVRSGGGDGGAPIWVEVSNAAQDIEAAELPLLFDRFYRRDRTRNGRRAGSGLGLPIARDLASLLGGSLTAHLSDGQITFRVELPPGNGSSS